jgi:hypothetical protein
MFRKDVDGKRLGLVLMDDLDVTTISGTLRVCDDDSLRLELADLDYVMIPNSLLEHIHSVDDEYREVLDEGEELTLVLNAAPFPESGDVLEHVRACLAEFED